VIAHLVSRPPRDREGKVRHAMRMWQIIGSPGYPPEPEELRARMERNMDRSYYPQGFLRHLAAIAATRSRVEELGRVRAPTLVIHGREDPFVRLEGGEQTARCIPGARLEIIDGMGHDLPIPLVPRLANLVIDHARAAVAAVSDKDRDRPRPGEATRSR
jgi:pimeloyl-ACP methyl ester carboxylesterase